MNQQKPERRERGEAAFATDPIDDAVPAQPAVPPAEPSAQPAGDSESASVPAPRPAAVDESDPKVQAIREEQRVQASVRTRFEGGAFRRKDAGAQGDAAAPPQADR